MRRHVNITPAQVRRFTNLSKAKELYGPKWEDMTRFLGVKYGIHHLDVSNMLRDAFRYIAVEVMRHGEHFTVPRFGRFFRNETRVSTQPFMGFTQKHSIKPHDRYENDHDDDEDAGPADE